MQRALIGWIVLLVVAIAGDARAEPQTLVVGTKQAPPFAMKGADGEWTGLSVELWRDIAGELGVSYRFVERDLESLLTAVEHGEVDVGVGAITITANRERRMDFSHTFYSSGLAIAVPAHSHEGVLGTISGMLTWEFLKVVITLLVLLAAVGALVWLVERHKNPQFEGGPVRGIGAGLWWSGVTMTTVGYGDKAPVTLVGRMLGLVWMFAAIIIVSFFTASMTSALTLRRLDAAIDGPGDLVKVRVATVPGSTSALYLEHRGIAFTHVPDVESGIRALTDGEVDAVVYDAPILSYAARRTAGDRVTILPHVFKREDYGFALPTDSPLRESLNRALLRELQRERWAALRDQFAVE